MALPIEVIQHYSGVHILKSEDIDTQAELNAILSDADLIKTEDLQDAIILLKGNAPVVAHTLEKLYNLLQPVLRSLGSRW